MYDSLHWQMSVYTNRFEEQSNFSGCVVITSPRAADRNKTMQRIRGCLSSVLV